MMLAAIGISFFFFFNDTATTEIYTLSLHDALPISNGVSAACSTPPRGICRQDAIDRKSTRLNSSHDQISYAVFCLKKKKKRQIRPKNKQKQKRHRIHQPHLTHY